MKKSIILLPLLCLCSLVGCKPEEEQYDNEPIVQDGSVGIIETGNAIANRALAEIGKPYEWGGVGPNTYDASGLVSYCVTGQHIRIGTCTTFMNYFVSENPVPGDICVNTETCGIYIGNGQMVFAPGFGEVVKCAGVQQGMIYVKYPGNN